MSDGAHGRMHRAAVPAPLALLPSPGSPAHLTLLRVLRGAARQAFKSKMLAAAYGMGQRPFDHFQDAAMYYWRMYRDLGGINSVVRGRA
jgi:hypothetical protein